MIRNLKILMVVAIALAAFGTLSTSAHAAEEEFHCAFGSCIWTLAPDETAGTLTAHQVFVVKGKTAGGAEASASFTCNQLTGQATSGPNASELTFTNLKYENSAGEQKCKVGASETVSVNFTSCDYNFKSANGATSTAETHVRCTTAGDGIDININGTLCLQITPFTSTGLGYHDSGIGGAKKIVTATAKVAVPNSALVLKNVGNANCAAVNMTSTTGAEYTTGNTLLKAERDPAEPEGWFDAEEFHCSFGSCLWTLAPDETATTTTAHQVFVVKGKTAGGAEASASFTCNQLTGQATSGPNASELTFTNLKYENSAGEQKCKVGAAETVSFDFTSCDYNFKSANGATSTAETHVRCTTAGDAIDINISGTLCLQITPFTSTGLGYHDSGIGGAKKIVTATKKVAVPNSALVLKNVGSPSCSALGLTSTTGAEYTTGNTLLKAERDPAEPEGWFE